MRRIPVNMARALPITRETAARVAAVACRCQSTLTLEDESVVLNLKSMIGLLSQSIPNHGRMTLVANGADEAEAAEEIRRLLEG